MKNPVRAALIDKINKTPGPGKSFSHNRNLWLWAVAALCALVPLPFFTAVEAGYEMPKATLLLVFVIVLGFLWLRNALHQGVFELPNKTITALVLLIMLSLIISTVLSINPLRSLIGDFMRAEGAIIWIAYLLLFFFVSSTGFTGREINFLIAASLIGASLASILGIAQFFGIGSLAASTSAGKSPFEAYRAYSTFGNPVMFAQYLALIFPVSLAFALTRDSNNRFISAIPAILVGLALIATFTRAAWLAVILSLIIVTVVYRPKIDAGVRKALLAGTLLFIVLAGVLLGLASAKDPSAMARFSPSAIKSGSAETRIHTYDIAVKSILERPAFGYGLENFRTAFTENRGDLFVASARFKELNDRVHNFILDLAVGGGLIFLGLFIALIFIVWLSSIGPGKKNLAITGLLAGTAGYLISLQFGFSTPGAASIFFVFLGILSNQAMGDSKVPIPINEGHKGPLSALSGVLAAIFILISLLPAISVYHYAQGENMRRLGNFESALGYYEKAISFFPWHERYHRAVAQSYTILYVEKGYGEKAIIQAKKAHDKAFELDPNDGDVLFYGGLFYLIFKDMDAGALNRSVFLLEKHLALDRYAIPTMLTLAEAYEQTERIENAQALRENAIELSARFGWLKQAEISDDLKEAATKLQAADPGNRAAAKYFGLTSD